MADSEYDQHNYGSGTFIGRDNYGSVRYELLDPSTRTTLANLSKDAPELASILIRLSGWDYFAVCCRRASKCGPKYQRGCLPTHLTCRPDINEDVANSLEFAGRNINEKLREQSSRPLRL